MTRFGSFVLCATLAAPLLACSSGSDNSSATTDPLQLIPVDGTVSGWTVDESLSKAKGQRAMVATDKDGAINLIDGGAEPFFRDPFKATAFLWQNYINNTLPTTLAPTGAKMTLYIVQMPSADQAKGIYEELLTESEYSRREWEDPTTPALGTDSRIQDTGTTWWINFYKGVFFVQSEMFPSYGGGNGTDYTLSDPTLKAEALRFAKAIADKM